MIDEMSFRVSRVIVRLKGIDLNQHERCDRPSIRNSNHIPNTVHLHVVSSRISMVKRILGSEMITKRVIMSTPAWPKEHVISVKCAYMFIDIFSDIPSRLIRLYLHVCCIKLNWDHLFLCLSLDGVIP